MILDLSLELLQAVAAVVGNGLFQLVALGLVVLLLAHQRLDTRGQPFQLPLQLLPPLLQQLRLDSGEPGLQRLAAGGELPGLVAGLGVAVQVVDHRL